MKKTEWPIVKSWYIEGEQTLDGLKYPTLEDVARRANRKPDSVRKVAGKEKWAEQRKQFQAKVQTLIKEDKSVAMAGESVSFDSECLEAARAGLAEVRRRLEMIKETRTGKSGDILVLSNALKILQASGRLAFGEVTEKTETTVHEIKTIEIPKESIREALGILANTGAVRLLNAGQPEVKVDEVHPDNANAETTRVPVS